MGLVKFEVDLAIFLIPEVLNTFSQRPTWCKIFFKYIYYDSLHVHVSSNILFILRRSNCINTASGIVILKTS